jgi:hypothetical protein
MAIDATQTDQLAQVIAHAIAPAFLLGAVSGFVAVLIGRMNGVMDRIRAINAIDEGDAVRGRLKADLPRLQHRARLLNRATLLAVSSAICITALVVIAFVSAFLGLRHEPGAAVMFLAALVLMGGALLTLALEVRIALTAYDHFT